MTQFIVDNRTDALNTDISCFLIYYNWLLTITNCQIFLLSLVDASRKLYIDNKRVRIFADIVKILFTNKRSEPADKEIFERHVRLKADLRRGAHDSITISMVSIKSSHAQYRDIALN